MLTEAFFLSSGAKLSWLHTKYLLNEETRGPNHQLSGEGFRVKPLLEQSDQDYPIWVFGLCPTHGHITIQEAEGEGAQIVGQPGLNSETFSKNKGKAHKGKYSSPETATHKASVFPDHLSQQFNTSLIRQSMCQI